MKESIFKMVRIKRNTYLINLYIKLINFFSFLYCCAKYYRVSRSVSRFCILLSVLANGYQSVSVDAEWPWCNFEQSHPHVGLRMYGDIKGPFHIKWCFIFFNHGATAHSGPGPPHYRGFTFTFKQNILVRTPLEEWSACHREIFLTKHNTRERERERESHQCRRRNSNPQIQQVSDRGPTS